MALSRSVLVSGGGIAGLAAALCLSRKGFHVEVCEQAPAFEPLGAGIQLSPNALHVLDALGIGDRLRMTATTPQAIRILSPVFGARLAEVPLGAEAIIRFGLPYLCIHRADLHQALLLACENDPDIKVRYASRVLDCTTHSNGISALVARDGRIDTIRGRFLVCADGMKSQLRHEVFDQSPARHTGHEAWRTMVPAERVPIRFPMEYTHLVMGRGCHAVFYPVRGGRHLNIVLVTRTRERSLETRHDADPGFVRRRTRLWNRHFRQLFAEAGKWSVWPLLETPPTRTWSRDAMVMIGDAAHGMPPYAAQGAALAIEDAWTLAECIGPADATADPANHGVMLGKAFDQFEKLRRKRVAKLAKLADTNRQIYHMGFPFSWARNVGMRMVPSMRLLTRQAWIYTWRPESENAHAADNIRPKP